MGGCTHAKYALLRCFYQSIYTDLHQTLSKYRAISGLFNSKPIFKLRRLAQGTLLWLRRVSEKLIHPVFILCAGIRQFLGRSQNGCETFTLDEFCTSSKNFSKLWSSNFLRFSGQFEGGECVHIGRNEHCDGFQRSFAKWQ